MWISKKVTPPNSNVKCWPPTISATRRGYFFRSPLEWLTWPFFFWGGIYVIPRGLCHPTGSQLSCHPPIQTVGFVRSQSSEQGLATWNLAKLWNPSNPRSESLTPDFGVSQIHTKYTCKVDMSQFGWFTLFVLFHLNLFHIIYQQHHHLYLMFCIIIYFLTRATLGVQRCLVCFSSCLRRGTHQRDQWLIPGLNVKKWMFVQNICHYACFFWIPEMWSTPLKHGCFRMFMSIYISTGTGCRRLNL